MYSKAERQKAVDLFIKYGKRAVTVVSELGYPNRHTLRLREKQHVSGTITLECDPDLDPGKVCKAYSRRWEIEIVMRCYKSACEFGETRVHDDYSAIGSEFCDFLSTVMTFRMLGAFDTARLLERMPYKKVMAALACAKKIRLVKIGPSQERILQ